MFNRVHPTNRPKPAATQQKIDFVLDTNAVVRMSPSLAVRVARALLNSKTEDKQILALAHQTLETYGAFAESEFMEEFEEDAPGYSDFDNRRDDRFASNL